MRKEPHLFAVIAQRQPEQPGGIGGVAQAARRQDGRTTAGRIGIEAQARFEAGRADVGRGAGRDDRRVQVGRERRVRERGFDGIVGAREAGDESAEREGADERQHRRDEREHRRGASPRSVDLEARRLPPQAGGEADRGDRMRRGGREHPARSGGLPDADQRRRRCYQREGASGEQSCAAVGHRRRGSRASHH